MKKVTLITIHAPNFMVDEECIRTGVKSFSSLIFERLKKNENQKTLITSELKKGEVYKPNKNEKRQWTPDL
jgi:hypothetical protein